MQDLTNKLLLYLCGTYFLIVSGLDSSTILTALLALITASCCSYFCNPRIRVLLIAAYSMFCIPYPLLGVYIPLSLYDSIQILYCGTGILHFLSLPLAAFGMIPLFFQLPGHLVFPCLSFLAVAFLLSKYTRALGDFQQKLHQLQDESKENSLLLNKKNQTLIQTQDYEIHVATLSERNRIAREIHDNVGHLLTRSILQTGALKVLNKDPSLVEPLTDLHCTLNTAMTNIRESVHDLHDESIDLSLALKDLVEHVDTPAISLDYDVESFMERDTKYAFIAIIREAIQNMQKHSDATRAEISLREHPAFYQLRIHDNGSRPDIKSSGIGLLNMRERVEALGGTIRFSTTDGFGIYIAIWRKQSDNTKIQEVNSNESDDR